MGIGLVNSWGGIVDGAVTYRLHKAQSDVMRSKRRFVAAIAGTGGGKTAVGPLWVMREIHKAYNRGEKILGMVVAPTYPIMARATAPTLVQMLAGTDLQGRYIETRNKYELPGNMGTIWMLSADKATALEGGQFQFAWIDEGGQIGYDAWVAIQGRLGQKRGRCLITTTPYTQNWLYRLFYLLWKAGDTNYYVRQWSSADNPAYPKEEQERAKKAMHPARYKMRYEGKFSAKIGLVYPDFTSVVRPFDPKEYEGWSYGGIDFGFAHPFCGLVGSWCADDKLRIWFERYRRYMTVGVHADALPTDATYWADSSRPDSIKDLRLAGLDVRPNKVKSISDGVDVVNDMIYTGDLVVHPECKALRAEAEQYEWPKVDDEVQSEKRPVDNGFDHAMDALRYLAANLSKIQGRLAA